MLTMDVYCFSHQDSISNVVLFFPSYCTSEIEDACIALCH